MRHSPSQTASLSATLLARKGQAGPSRLHTPVHRPLRPISGVTGSGHFDTETISDNDGTPPQNTSEKMVRKSVRLPKSVDDGLRILAARDGISQQALLADLVHNLLQREGGINGCLCGRAHGSYDHPQEDSSNAAVYSGARAKQS